MRIKVSDIEESNYYKMPKAIYQLDLKPIDREVYMMCLENWRLSVSNKWVNENGEIYFYATQEKISEMLRVTKKTILTSFKKLIETGLLETEKDKGNINRYFLKKIEKCKNYSSVKITPQKCKNYTTSSVKITPNKEERNKNELTRINIYISERFKKTFSDFLDMRKSIKKPATNKAIEMIIMKLEKVNNEEQAIKMLERSIINNWQDVYEIQERGSNGNKNYSTTGGAGKREVITRDYNAGTEGWNK